MGQEICLVHGQVSLSLLYSKRNLQTDICCPGETDEKAANIQARLFMVRTLGENGKECQAEGERQRWSHEKPQLDNARKLRGIYFIDPEDKECEETIKNARKKLETPVAPAMPCKISKNNQHVVTSGKSNEITSKLACILEASESTRLRMGESLPNHHGDHIVRKGDKSLQHYNLVHKFISMPQAMKIPAAKAAVDKEWKQLEKISAWNLTKVRSKKEVIDEDAKVHFASLMDTCHLKNAELETKHQKYKGRVVLLCDIVKDDSGSYAVFTDPGSSASQMTAAKIMDVISRLPACDGQAADAISAKTQVKLKYAPPLFKIPKSECPDIWIRLPRHKWPKSWSSMEDPVVPLERNLYGHPLAENFRISSWSYDMESHAKKCVERYCELANRTTQQLYKVSTPCIDDHHFKEEELKSVGELSKICSQIVLKCLLILGTHWLTRHSKQTCTSSHQNGPELVTNAWLV